MKEFATLHPHFLHGADYNPDQWLAYPDVLAQDPEMMVQAHCNCMAVGIFSGPCWNRYAPSGIFATWAGSRAIS